MATIILGSIFLMLLGDFRTHRLISIPTPPITLLTIFYADDKTNAHPSPISWYFISSLWWYLYSCMHTMSILWSITDAVGSSSWPILFKVLKSNVTFCIVHLYLSSFCLNSVADFSNTGARAPISAGPPPFLYLREGQCRLDMWFGVRVMVVTTLRDE